MASHRDSDPMVVFVDDFSASGETISKGIRKFKDKLAGMADLGRYLAEKRVFCALMFALPDAIERMRDDHPDVPVLTAQVLGDDVRAFDPNSGIFQDEAERQFAREVMLQIGRELVPQHPLGWNDIGGLICFHNTVPNNTLPIFWSSGTVADKQWKALFPRA